MQMTTEARAWLDSTVKRILARHHLGDAERAGITYELMSHLHAAAEARATAAGRGEVARDDLVFALAEAGGEDRLAAAFVQPLAKPIERAHLGPRAVALAVDVVILGLALVFLHGVLDVLLAPAAGESANVVAFSDFDDRWGFMPWGIHETIMPLWARTIVAIASAAVVLGYFTWLEGREGRSLGKRAMGLRVMRVDGAPMTYREAFLRNLAKLSPPVLLLDTLGMLIAFSNERQRVSDRIADTIVVKA